jgi:uncharacterized membrane protein YcaP (DUF421 family)
MNNVLEVLYKSLLSFFVLFILSKVLGKKQVAQLEFIDYVVGISIGSIAAQMSVDSNIPYYHFIIAMAVYAIFDLSITLVSRKCLFLKNLFKGKPLIIINQGKIDYKTLKKSKLDLNELLSQCRANGFFNISQINYLIFEPSGNFSIMPKAEFKPAEKQDLKIKDNEDFLSLNLIMDGKIKTDALKQSGKSLDWVYKKTNSKTKKHIKNVLLFSYFKKDDTFAVFFKDNS